MLKRIKEKKGIKTTIVAVTGFILWILNYVSITYGLVDLEAGKMIEKGVFAGVLFFIGIFSKDANKTHSK